MALFVQFPIPAPLLTKVLVNNVVRLNILYYDSTCVLDEKRVRMKNQHIFSGYVLIGVGVYFLMKQLNLAIFSALYYWPTFLMIIGIAFLIHSYSYRVYENIFIGVLLLGLGIHFHGLALFDFWIDHWSIYALIVGCAFLIRYTKLKTDFIVGILLISVAILMIFSVTLPTWFQWIYGVIDFLETFWPVALIGVGFYLLRFNK